MTDTASAREAGHEPRRRHTLRRARWLRGGQTDQVVVEETGSGPKRTEPRADIVTEPPETPAEEPLGEEGPLDVAELPDLVEVGTERDIQGWRGGRRFLHAAARWALLAALAGAAAGIGASLFIVGLDALVAAVNHVRATLPWWAIVAFPPTGAVVVGYLLWRADRVAFVSACGTDSFIDAVEEADGDIRARVPVLRMIGAWLTIGFGGSSGRECPMIYTGAGLGSTVGQLLRRVRRRLPEPLAEALDLSGADTRLLAMCGAAGALGAVFSAPFGGAIFAVEVPYRRDIDMDLFLPALVSSVTGFLVGWLLVGRQRLLVLPGLGFFRWPEWVLVGVMAVAGSLMARLFAGIFNGFHSTVRRAWREDHRIPKWLQTGLGGLLAGVVMLAFPQVYGIGLDAIRQAAAGTLFANQAVATTIMLLAAMAVAKIVASTCTVATGGVGGLLFPSLFAGAGVGAAIATAANHLWPGQFPHHAAYVLIAMSATYAAAGKVPLASLLLLCEACVNFTLALPMAVANGLAYLLSGRSTVYDVQRDQVAAARHRSYRWAIPVCILIVLFGRFVTAL